MSWLDLAVHIGALVGRCVVVGVGVSAGVAAGVVGVGVSVGGVRSRIHLDFLLLLSRFHDIFLLGENACLPFTQFFSCLLLGNLESAQIALRSASSDEDGRDSDQGDQEDDKDGE